MSTYDVGAGGVATGRRSRSDDWKQRSPGWIVALNTKYHDLALKIFAAIVILHWTEHIVQAIQIWGLGWERKRAQGVLGVWFPWLASSEALHYGFAIVMLVFLFVLRHGFSGRARTWWDLSLYIQFWHHIEHFLLLLQAILGQNFWGSPVPTSIVQLIFPRVELHLFYNAIVTIPMVVAMVLHFRQQRGAPSVASGARA